MRLAEVRVAVRGMISHERGFDLAAGVAFCSLERADAHVRLCMTLQCDARCPRTCVWTANCERQRCQQPPRDCSSCTPPRPLRPRVCGLVHTPSHMRRPSAPELVRPRICALSYAPSVVRPQLCGALPPVHALHYYAWHQSLTKTPSHTLTARPRRCQITRWSASRAETLYSKRPWLQPLV